jgi:Tol biopolymer transport system component
LSNAVWYPPLYMVSIADGEARKLSESTGQDAAFAPDGRVILAKGKSLYIAEKDGSNPRALCEFPHYVYNPVVSPDGQKIRLTVWRDFSTRTLWEVGIDGKGPHPLINSWESTVDSCCGRWTADGKYFVFQSRREGRTDIWALTEEKRWLQRSTLPVRLTDGPLSYQLPYPSPDGEHLFAIGLRQLGQIVRYDRSAKDFVPYLSGISAMDATVSRDGKWVTYLSYPDLTVWRSRADGKDPLQLTRPNIPAIYPRISPDGKKVIFGSVDENGTDALYVMPSAGGSPRKIADNAKMANWSPDSRSVVFFVSENPASGLGFFGLRTINVQSGETKSIPDSAVVFEAYWVSQDRLVGPTIKAGVPRLVSFDFKTQKWSDVSTGAFQHLVQSIDGKYLYYTTGQDDADLMRIRLNDRHAEKIASLKDFHPLVGESIGSWMGVAPDGSVLLTRDIGSQEIYSLSVRWP